jgi:PEP-CTERM/exosortase A-associated glycosyltransferase
LRRADAVTTICQGLRQDIVARGIDAARVTVVPNAVDLGAFQDNPPRDQELMARLGLDPDKTIGFIGSFYAYEGLDLLIEAVARLGGDLANLKVLLVGGGPEEDRLKELAKAKGVEDRVVFTGRVPHQEVQRFYGLLDVFAYPRHRMRLTDLVTPLKPLETMAQGKLVLASDVGGHRELIADGKTGILFPADDADGLAQALRQVFDKRSDWPAICAAGRDFVERERTWDASVANYEPVYERLIQGNVATVNW